MEMPGVYPQEYVEQVALRDGSVVTLRPIHPDDAPRLQEGFKRLSSETIYLRFLETFNELTDKQAQYFANVDYQQQMAIVGAVLEDGEEHLVAVARYAMVEADVPGVAEAAIVVRDDYQRRGLGTEAMRLLADYARGHGVDYFQAEILMSNRRIQRFIQRSGLPFERHMLEPGTWGIRIRLDI